MEDHSTSRHLADQARKKAKERLVNREYQNALLDAMGKDREVFEAALSSSDNPKIRAFFMAFCSFKYQNWPVARIAAKFGIKEAELSALWKDYHLSRAMLTVTAAIPKAMTRIVQDAVSGETICPHCDGRTTVKVQVQQVGGDPGAEPEYEIIVCPQCKGEGMVFKPGHEHSRDKMLQLVGWGPKAGTTNVQLNQNIRFGGVQSVIEELEHEKVKIIDAKVLQQIEAPQHDSDNRIPTEETDNVDLLPIER